jgi:uncharacterized protein YsxB (DUF464 family)
MPDSPSSSDETSLLNLRQLRSFIVFGHADFLELLEDMKNDIPIRLDAVREAMIASDAAECAAAAHVSRGALSYFGCVALNKRLAEIEAQETVDPSQAENVFNELHTLWDDTLAQIKEWERGVPEFNS